MNQNEQNNGRDLRELSQQLYPQGIPNPYIGPYSHPNGTPVQPNVRETGSKRDLIFSGIFFILSLLCVNFLFYGGAGSAFAVAALGLYVGGLLYLRPHRRGGGFYMAFCILSYVLCAFTLVLSDSSMGAFFSVTTMFGLSGITLNEYMALRRENKGTIRCASDWFRTQVVLPFGNIGNVFYALFRKKSEDGTVEKRKINSVLIGLLCAVPVLLMVIPLLMGADGAFEGMMDKIGMDGGKELPATLIFGTALFILIFGQHFGAKIRKQEEKQSRSARKGMDTAFLITFLSVIALVYVLYLVSQLAYFFNAFAGLLPKEFTVAEYARRGFFEMSAVCVINLGLLFFALLGARKKENGKEPVMIRILSVFLCLFSLVLIATAMSKMNLYILSFGMTYLRILTSVFMVFLCVVFCTMCLWIFFRKLPYMRVVVITAVILVLGVSFADPARVVAYYNVSAYQTGKLDSVDMDELYMLESDGVVPYVWKLTEDSDELVKRDAWEIICEHAATLGFFDEDGEEGSYDWRSFNFGSYRAYCLIRDNWDTIYPEACDRGYVSCDQSR